MDTSQEEKLNHWRTQTLEGAVQHLLDLGFTDTPLVEAKPVWILPFQLMIGKIREDRDETSFSWFIAGDFPTDHVESSIAASVREAARYFALRLQVRAANESESGNDLAERAESLYQLTQDDRLWAAK